MDSPQTTRCGYTWPQGHERHGAIHQSCCVRETFQDSNRCAWHTNSDATNKKTIEALQDVLSPSDIQEETRPVGELLDGAQLAHLTLEDSISFERTALRDADLTNTDLKNADLSGADLRHTNLTNADLEGADLRNTDLRGADLTNANLESADLIDANLWKANLNGAVLTRANLTSAYLPRADLTGARLLGTNLADTNLMSTNLTDTNFGSANLADADLSQADLTDSYLPSANIIDANLEDADLTDADLEGADLTDADLRDADLINTNFQAANLTRAIFEHATLIRTNLFNANLTGSKPHGATFTDVQINDDTDFRAADAPEEHPSGLLSRLATSFHKIPIEKRPFVPLPRCGYDPAVFRLREEDSDPDQRDEDQIKDLISKAADTYQSYEKLAGENAQPSLQSSMFVLRQDMQRARYWHVGRYFEWLFARMSRTLFKYGESLSRILTWALFIILTYTMIYARSGIIVDADGNAITSTVDALYFSTLTFTTLGLGDFRPDPTSEIGRLLVTGQAALGTTLIAVFVFVLGRRAAK